MSVHAWYTSDDYCCPCLAFRSAAQLACCADERYYNQLERCLAAIKVSLREQNNKRMGSWPKEWGSLAVKTKYTSDPFALCSRTFPVKHAQTHTDARTNILFHHEVHFIVLCFCFCSLFITHFLPLCISSFFSIFSLFSSGMWQKLTCNVQSVSLFSPTPFLFLLLNPSRMQQDFYKGKQDMDIF